MSRRRWTDPRLRTLVERPPRRLVAQDHHADEEQQRNSKAVTVFGAEGAYKPNFTRLHRHDFSEIGPLPEQARPVGV